MSDGVKVLSYIRRDSPVHRLCGVTKLIVFLAWTIVCMLTFDTRILLAAALLSVIIFRISKIKLKEVSFVLKWISIFLVLNALTVYLFSPEEGVKIYGTRHELFRFTDHFTVTQEQLLYLLNIILKYFTIGPIALIFMATTHPSEFAASLNRVGVPYKICYAVAIALRYISDIQSDYTEISQAQQARGVDLSKNVPLKARVKGLANIAVPLIFSSLDRIDLVSNAMDLRGFGKNRKRSWYSARPFQKADYLVITVTLILSAFALWITFRGGSRFWNPFIS